MEYRAQKLGKNTNFSKLWDDCENFAKFSGFSPGNSSLFFLAGGILFGPSGVISQLQPTELAQPGRGGIADKGNAFSQRFLNGHLKIINGQIHIILKSH